MHRDNWQIGPVREKRIDLAQYEIVEFQASSTCSELIWVKIPQGARCNLCFADAGRESAVNREARMLFSRASTDQNPRQDRDAVVLAEQVKLLYGSPIIVLINPVNASIVAVLLWQMYPAWVIFVWLGLFLVVTGVRAFLAHRYRRQQQTVDCRRYEDSMDIDRRQREELHQ